MAVFQQHSGKIPEILTLSSHESSTSWFWTLGPKKNKTLSMLEEYPNSKENTRLLPPTLPPTLAGEELKNGCEASNWAPLISQ